MKPDIELVGCTQSYGIASGGYRRVLTDISMTLCGNEVVLVRGPSGSGKSTLGRILALWEMPHHGTIRVRGHAITSLREGAVWRRGFVSYVPQHLALVPEWTAWDNCEWALQPLGLSSRETSYRLARVLETLSLTEYRRTPAGLLSGGQQQRLAMARALACSPQVLIADEPTRSLDKKTLGVMHRAVEDFMQDPRHAIILISHLEADRALATRMISMQEGRLG